MILSYLLVGVGSKEESAAKQDSDCNKTCHGCFKLQRLSLMDIEKVSLATLGIVLLYLTKLSCLEHDRLHEALELIKKAGKTSTNIVKGSHDLTHVFFSSKRCT